MPHAPYLMPKLIEWDSLQIRVNGDKVNEIAARFRVDPIERMTLRFFNGLLRVEGSLRKFISVPFSVDIAEILADGTTIRVYADGLAAGSTAIGGAMNNPAGPSLMIGKSVVGAYYFNGSISDAAVYGSALTFNRLLAHYQAGVGRTPTSTELGPASYAPTALADGPLAYWRLGDSAGAAANQINHSPTSAERKKR